MSHLKVYPQRSPQVPDDRKHLPHHVHASAGSSRPARGRGARGTATRRVSRQRRCWCELPRVSCPRYALRDAQAIAPRYRHITCLGYQGILWRYGGDALAHSERTSRWDASSIAMQGGCLTHKNASKPRIGPAGRGNRICRRPRSGPGPRAVIDKPSREPGERTLISSRGMLRPRKSIGPIRREFPRIALR